MSSAQLMLSSWPHVLATGAHSLGAGFPMLVSSVMELAQNTHVSMPIQMLATA